MPKSAIRKWNLDDPDSLIEWLAERETLPFWNANRNVDFIPNTYVKRRASIHFVEVLDLKTKERVEEIRAKIRSDARWGKLLDPQGSQGLIQPRQDH
jgi:hypothetical protein